MLSFQSTNVAQNMQNSVQPQDPIVHQNNVHVHHTQQPQTIQTMRLRDEPPPITPATRNSRKRKSPPSNTTEQTTPVQPQQQQQQQQQQLQHVLPPPHTLIHPHSIPGHLPPGYQYGPADYTPGGIPPPNTVQQPQGIPHQQQSQSPPPSGGAGGRALSSSKRAEQNRKAQRAFRERRDQHVKALESRSQLLDAALASADEANRRWEECRALVDQLRVENAALRAALSQAQLLPPGAPPPPEILNNNHMQSEEVKLSEGSDESKKDAVGASEKD